VVFQLLIFFVCTMKFAAMEGNLPAFLPKKEKATSAAAEQKPIEQQELEDITIGLEMRDGKIEISVGQAILPNFRQLAFKLSRLHKQFPKNPVILDAKADVPFGNVVEALDACASAQYFNVSFAAPPEKLGT
ncbi:MAG: biopolymer transporter ExbD, partial [Planctomycetes bacterium]|nr:biopolymer transporter ExbD [Planctomycetota bacterium]